MEFGYSMLFLAHLLITKHPSEKKNSILQLDFDAVRGCTPSSTNLILSPISPSTTHGCEKLVEHQQEILRSFVPSFSYPHLYAWATNIGFSQWKNTGQHLLGVFLNHPNFTDISHHPFHGASSFQPTIRKCVKCPKMNSHSRISGDQSENFHFQTLQGTSFLEPPLLRQGTRNTLLSRRVFRSEPVAPSPQKSTKSTPPIGCSSDPTHSSLSSKVVTVLIFLFVISIGTL